MFLVCFCFDKCSPHHQWNRNEIKNYLCRLLCVGPTVQKQPHIGELGRGRSWCTDVHNTLDVELKRKILFLNANGRKNSEREGKTVQMLHYVHNDM